MAGQFSKSNRPKRPGAYFNFSTVEQEPVLINTLGIAVVPFTHSWGPSKTVTELNSFGEFLAIFGQGGTTPPVYTEGYKAVLQAFQGEGLPSRGGAGRVLAYRMTGAGAAKATRALSNATVPALTLSARWEGTHGNKISVRTQDNARNVALDDLVVYIEGKEVERFRYANSDITALAAEINASSDWVSASAVTTGSPLVYVGSPTPVALTGGLDGAAPAAADYTAFMAGVEPYRFSLLAPANLTDASILASLVGWSQTMNASGKRFVTVVGGGTTATPDTITAAIVRSASINDPNFVNLGGGLYEDERLGELTPAQLAPRVAGVLARRGEKESLTFARLAGLSIVIGATDSETINAIENGVVTIARDSHPTAPVRLEKGLTTWTTTSDPDRPFNIYSVPKFVRTLHAIERELTEFAEHNVIGRLPVNDATRAYVVGETMARLASREADGIVRPGWTVGIDQNPPPADTDDFVALLYGVTLGRSLEQVFNTVIVG